MSKGVLLVQSAIEAQKSIIGSMLIDPELVGSVLSRLTDKDFIDDTYRAAFLAFRRLHAQGRPIEPLTVNDALGGNWNKVLAECMDWTATTAHIDEYVEILRKRALQYRLAQLGDRLADADDLDAALAAVDAIEAERCGKPGVKITTMEQAYGEFLDRHADGVKPDYLTWGIPALDDKVHVEPGDFMVLGGYPSAGKTALALQFCRHIARGKRVGYFYLENNDRKLFDRVVASVSMVPFQKIKTHDLGEDDFHAIVSMQDQLTSPKLEFIGASGMTVSDIRAVALSRHYDMIVVDYLQKIRGDRSRMTDFERVSQISSDLQELGQQTGIYVMALSQLSRPEKKNGKTPAPTMASLRQSGQIEQDADVVMLVYCEDESQPRLRTLKLAKNKEGMANIAMRMVFDGDTQTFSRVSPKQEPTTRQKPRQNSFWGDGSDWMQIPDGPDNPFTEEQKQ